MKCPMCDAVMREINRRGVHIDVCPECKGVWLDRGELEKIIAASREDFDDYAPRQRDYPSPARGGDHPQREPSHDHHKYDHHKYGYHKPKKKRFFEEIFEIFD